MASSPYYDNKDDTIVIAIAIAINSSDQIGAEIAGEECFISASQIQTWNLSSILSSPVVKVQAHRSRLISQSSFFRGMLNWSFSESRLDQISIKWDLEAFLNVVKCIYGCRIDISCENFLASYEAALYFGVEILLENCKTWFSDAMSPQIPLDDLISIWNFGIKHYSDFLPELCESYLAKNFMWAVSCESFVHVPGSLLLGCVKHQHLKIESRWHLCDAKLKWLKANIRRYSEVLSSILEQRNKAKKWILEELEMENQVLTCSGGVGAPLRARAHACSRPSQKAARAQPERARRARPARARGLALSLDEVRRLSS